MRDILAPDRVLSHRPEVDETRGSSGRGVGCPAPCSRVGLSPPQPMQEGGPGGECPGCELRSCEALELKSEQLLVVFD